MLLGLNSFSFLLYKLNSVPVSFNCSNFVFIFPVVILLVNVFVTKDVQCKASLRKCNKFYLQVVEKRYRFCLAVSVVNDVYPENISQVCDSSECEFYAAMFRKERPLNSCSTDN